MKKEKSGIVCVGIICADILGKTVDELPEKGKLSIVNNISLQIGGCAANVAISLAKIGLDATIVAKIGKDNLGAYILDALQNEHVNIGALQVDKKVSTSASMVMISADGERSILHSFGANEHFNYDDIDLNIISESRILLIAGTFLMPSFDGRGTERLLKYAQGKGVICCMDTAWDSKGEWMEKIESSLAYLDWFMPSYDEACEITRKSKPDEIANVLIGKGVRNVIIKMNAEGCYVKPGGDEGFLVPSYSRVNPVDSSGAGDSFCAGFISGLYQGWDVAKCAAFANAVGAHCIMQVGTTTGIRSMNEILSFMMSYETETS
jgi:sugar/nucleoside kinase (ribokinase family)